MQNQKYYYWFPYVSEINCEKAYCEITFQGGKEKVEWKMIRSIMFYGSVCDLSELFMEQCATFCIPVVIHRRTMSKAVWITPSITNSKDDLVTRQILFRENSKKRCHITKQLLKAKFKSMEWLQPFPELQLYRNLNQKELIQLEAWHARQYWKKYYQLLGYQDFSRRKTSPNNELTQILDATSKFISGIILRWILYHRLSPFHGFSHIPSTYPALVYDLMEPNRGYVEKVIFNKVRALQKEKLARENFLPICIEELKDFLYSDVYVNETRQVVSFHELNHGIILALRSYLMKNTKKFIVPKPSKPRGGRPIKAGYRLYGHQAGKTDFWVRANCVANNFKKYLNS